MAPASPSIAGIVRVLNIYCAAALMGPRSTYSSMRTCCRFWSEPPGCKQLPEFVVHLAVRIGGWHWHTEFAAGVEDT